MQGKYLKNREEIKTDPDGTYGGFTKQDILDIQDAGFKQQNKIFQQGWLCKELINFTRYSGRSKSFC